MSFFSLVAVMLLEHFRPLVHRVQLYVYFARYGNFLERHFNAGRYRYGLLAWGLGILPPVLALAIFYFFLYRANFLLALLFNAGVLYLTLGCSLFTQSAGKLALALRDHDLDAARKLLGDWEGRSIADFNAVSLTRIGMEKLLLCAHRQFFGVFFWFAVLGPAGALLYRLAHILHQKWGALDHREYGRFGIFSDTAFRFLDWLPLRLTAVSFAVVGDFEDAIRCWQEQAAKWANPSQGIILASGAGALGVRLGDPLEVDGQIHYRPELGLGEEPDADYLNSAVSLIWRAISLWLGLLLLLTIAKWAGS
jgi:adenosylcobinamide-phosphate synthase